MAHRIEENPVTGRPEMVIDGFEMGVSDSPEFGIANMMNINNDSTPGIAQCNYSLVSLTQGPLSGSSFSVSFTSVSNLLTLTTGLLNSHVTTVAVFFTNLTGSTGLSAGSATSNVYWLNYVSGTTATVWSTYDQFNGLGSQVSLGTGGGTITVIKAGRFTGYTPDQPRNQWYLQDSLGQVWVIPSFGAGPVMLTGNTTGGAGQGIAIYKDFLFVFTANKIDMYGPLDGGGSSHTWHTAQFTISHDTTHTHYAKWSQIENNLYFCDGNQIAVVTQTGTASDYTTYSLNEAAMTLPINEVSSYLEEPSIDTGSGVTMYIGTSTSPYIYVWDEISTTSTQSPLVMPEIGTYAMLNINKIVYILAGKRGNIYYTNGSSVVHFSSVPKYATGSPFPSFTWGGVMSLNNNFCFGVNDAASGSIGNTGGVWAITLALGQLLNSVAGAIRYKNQPSLGLYNSDILIPSGNPPNGFDFYSASYNGSYGIVDALASPGVLSTAQLYSYDSSTTTLPSTGTSYLETEIIPIGTALNPKNFTVIEAKLDTPLVSGEKFRICARTDLSASYFSVFEQTTVGSIDGNNSNSGLSTQNLKWIQFRADLQAAASGSFTRLREIRLR